MKGIYDHCYHMTGCAGEHKQMPDEMIEFAFMIDGFDEWQVDDRAECFMEVVEGQ